MKPISSRLPAQGFAPPGLCGRLAAALALREGATVITGNPEFAALKDLLKIDWIGPKR